MSEGFRLPPLEALLDIYRREMDATGGPAGLRDAGGLESALARPQNRMAYAGDVSDVHALAAAMAFGIARNHPFVDGNKRMTLIAAFTTLRLNGWYLDAPENETVEAVLGLADGKIDETGFAGFLKKWSWKT